MTRETNLKRRGRGQTDHFKMGEKFFVEFIVEETLGKTVEDSLN